MDVNRISILIITTNIYNIFRLLRKIYSTKKTVKALFYKIILILKNLNYKLSAILLNFDKFLLIINLFYRFGIGIIRIFKQNIFIKHNCQYFPIIYNSIYDYLNVKYFLIDSTFYAFGLLNIPFYHKKYSQFYE